jgi:hypothetical protein
MSWPLAPRSSRALPSSARSNIARAPFTPRFEDSTGYAGTRNSRNAKISDVYGADIAKLPRVSSKRGVKPRDRRSRGPPADSFHAKGRPAMGKTLYKKLEFNF